MCPDFTNQNDARVITLVLMRTSISFEFGKYTDLYFDQYLYGCCTANPSREEGGVEAATTPPPPFYHDLSVLVIIIACKSVLIVSGVLIFAAAKVMAIKHYVNVSITIND